jgi:hypothetical protein
MHNARMKLQNPSGGQPGEAGATHKRLSDGTLFRPGPDGRAETFFGGTWVPAGWSNSDLLNPTFVPYEGSGKSDRSVHDEN